MSYPQFDDQSTWGGSASPALDTGSTGDIVRDAIRKEQLIKEIAASQEDLRNMLARAKAVQKETDKLAAGNETLQMYIDNLTVQMAKRRG
ncbi:hypothetical protein HGRIS_005672 [Hohenbuehelia grisea]|uniref:Uncharacterized protein n=1 Tax=Hohenbuehelia grisea TaxID=104357 RepID=A0ABR3JYK9_9AGAR